MKKHTWTADERDEYEALLDDALAVSVVAARRDVFLAGLDAAMERDPRPLWAVEAMHEMRVEGGDRILTREQAARRPRVPVARNGVIIGKVPRVMGRQDRNATGGVEYQRTLFDFLTWDDIRARIGALLRNRSALDTDVHALRRLLTLENEVPGAATPAEACTHLGTTVEEYLGSEDVAS